MLSKQEVLQIIENAEYNCLGLRVDDYQFNIGDKTFNSHNLSQDPDWNENDELIHPYVEEGIYAGYYDAGELNGTCCIDCTDVKTEEKLEQLYKVMKNYGEGNLYLIAGHYKEYGNDYSCSYQEIIIEDAEVIVIIK